MNVLFETIKRTLAGGSEGELPVLKKWRKSIHQIVERNHGPLYLELPSPKEVLANWLQEEIEYLETVEPKIDKADSQSKIHTSVSVPVLALFTRVLKESEFFTNTNQSEILKFISAHYTSLRKGSISYNHLQSKYYQFDEPTKKKLYEMLIGMANIVKKLN